MRIAYIVLAHTAPGQLCRLVERLDRDSTHFLMHVDRRSSKSIFDDAFQRLSKNPRVTFIERTPTQRTTFGGVEAPLRALSLLARKEREFDYAILVTGQDYPLKSNDEIAAFFEQNSGACFLHAFAMEDPNSSDWPSTENSRYRYWHYWIGRHHRVLRLHRNIPAGLKPFGGSAYWALPREAVLYVTDFVENERRFVRFFRHTYAPDEMFFQTILMNSPFREQVASLTAPCCYALHYIDWSPGRAHPETLVLSDLPRLRATPALFGRKFDAGVDRDVLDTIDTQLLGWHVSERHTRTTRS